MHIYEKKKSQRTQQRLWKHLRGILKKNEI